MAIPILRLTSFLLLLPMLLLLPQESTTTATTNGTRTTPLYCSPCGQTQVPYPLSTSPTCGDPFYPIRCNGTSLWFDTRNNTLSYPIKSINRNTHSFTILPKPLNPNQCTNTDISAGGFLLSDTSPFTIANSNTIMQFNCTYDKTILSAMDCSPKSICHDYLRSWNSTGGICRDCPYCCLYTAGGSRTAYKIDISLGQSCCSAYQSFVGLDPSLPGQKWPTPGIEIEWSLPMEPACNVDLCCQQLNSSSCLLDSKGKKRCLCNTGFQWDPIQGVCSYLECGGKTHCSHINKKLLVKVLTIILSTILLTVMILIILYNRRLQIKRKAYKDLVKKREEFLNANMNSGKSAKLFSGKDLKKATNNFAQENLLGVGGFGEVFKGILDDGTLTAVKRAKPGNTKGLDQVLNEVRILCQLNHKTLVRLLGCCLELEQPILVYEFVANGNLFEHLHSRFANKWATLTWQRRLLIAQQTSEGIAYLHFSAVPPIYHRDIKSSNILLDDKLDAKVADFGLSRLVDSDKTHISTCAQGTLGYLDPDYYHNFQLTDKSDVYSFGVVMLELLTSKKAIDFNREDEDVNLAVYAKKMTDKEKLIEIFDPALKERATKIELETAKAMGLLAVACLDEVRQNRPTMREVAEEIEYMVSVISNNKDG